METLDEYLLANIYKYLSYTDIYNVSFVSKHLNKGFNVYHLWKYKYDELDDDNRINGDNLMVTMRTISKLCKIRKCLCLYISIKQLYNKDILDIPHKQLTDIPKEISYLINLKKLHLDNDKLTSIPKEIGCLTSLKYLYLDENQLTCIPEEIKNLNCYIKY